MEILKSFWFWIATGLILVTLMPSLATFISIGTVGGYMFFKSEGFTK